MTAIRRIFAAVLPLFATAAAFAAVPRNAFQGQYYDNTNFTSLKLTRTDTRVSFNWGLGSPHRSINADTFAVRWTGDWDFSHAGTYRFTVTANDGVRVLVDGATVLEQWGDRNSSISLVQDWSVSAGTHQVQVDYYDKAGSARVQVAWAFIDTQGPSVQITSPAANAAVRRGNVALQAAAVDNFGEVRRVTFRVRRGSATSGAAIFTSSDLSRPYETTWRAGSQAEGPYTVQAAAADGEGNVGSAFASITLLDDVTPPVISEVAASPGAGSAVLSWTTNEPADSQVEYGLTMAYGQGTVLDPVLVTEHARSVTGLQEAALYHYRVKSEDGSGNAAVSDDFTFTTPDLTPPSVSVRRPIAGDTVSGTVAVEAEASDNAGVAGVRFQLDGVDLGSEDRDPPYSVSWDSTRASPGSHLLTAVARDAAGRTALASLQVTVRNVPRNAFLAEYFDTKELADPKLLRQDPVIHFDWGASSPHPSMEFDAFSARWTGDWDFASTATYTFRAATDDGVRVRVDGQLVIDDWTDRALVRAADKLIAAGSHRVEVEYKENGGGASARVTGMPVVPVNAFLGEYFNELELAGLALIRTDDAINFGWGLGSPHPSIAPDTFSVRWTGDWDFPVDGTCRFTAVTDDGVRMWLDGDPVLTRWQNSAGTTEGSKAVTAGRHRIKVEYKENGGGASARLSWAYVDGAAPAVSLTAPSPSSEVSDTVRVTADASDNVQVVGVQFMLDGANLGAEDTTPPFSLVWDTFKASTGPHSLAAAARDASGLRTISSPVGVTVARAAPAPVSLAVDFSRSSGPVPSIFSAGVMKLGAGGPTAWQDTLRDQKVGNVRIGIRMHNVALVRRPDGRYDHAHSLWGGEAWNALRDFANEAGAAAVREAREVIAQGGTAVIGITGMPKFLSSCRDYNDQVPGTGWWGFNTCSPASFTQWEEAIRAVFFVIGNQLTPQEAEKVYFEVWNEPDGNFWSASNAGGDQEGAKRAAYFELYRQTVIAARRISRRFNKPLRVGGPDVVAHLGPTRLISQAQDGWIRDFIVRASTTPVPELADIPGLDTTRTPIDFLVWHEYHELPAHAGGVLPRVRDWLRETGYDPGMPTFVTEVNCGLSFFKTKELDSEYNAAYMVGSVLNFQRNGLTHYTFASLGEQDEGLDEYKNAEFRQSMGLFTVTGTRKPVYNGLRALGKLSGSHVPVQAAAAGEGTQVDAAASISSSSAAVVIANFVPNPAHIFNRVVAWNAPSGEEYFQSYLWWLFQAGTAEEELVDEVIAGLRDPYTLPVSPGMQAALREGQKAAAKARFARLPVTVDLSASRLSSADYPIERRYEVGPVHSNAYAAWLAHGGPTGGEGALNAGKANQHLALTAQGERAPGDSYGTVLTMEPNSVTVLTFSR